MRSESSVTVNYANHNYAFMKFQEQYRNLCQQISEEKRKHINKSYLKAKSFIYEYLSFVNSKDVRTEFKNMLDRIKDGLYYDAEFIKLCRTSNRTSTQAMSYNQSYYIYLVKILKLVGLFGDELSRTLMPNKTDREKAIRFSTNNSFFEQFTVYKSNCAEKVGNFSLRNFKGSFAYLLGFYFAYYLFIDERSRYLCEDVFSNILNIVLTKKILNLIVVKTLDLGNDQLNLLRDMDYQIHNAIDYIVFRCNYSYSNYGVMPKLQEKILVDRTAI